MNKQDRWEMMSEPFALMAEELDEKTADNVAVVAQMDQGMAALRAAAALYGLDMDDEDTVFAMCATAALMMTVVSEGLTQLDRAANTNPMQIVAEAARDYKLTYTALGAFRLFAPERVRKGQAA